MILVDTTIWIDHLRDGSPLLLELLRRETVLTHPFVIGELALGSIQNRGAFLAELDELPSAPVASAHEVRTLIEKSHLHGTGIGYIDAHLIASVRIKIGASLWSRDHRLTANAERLGIAARPHDA